MQVVILAGGLGTRLQPLTASIPKCMIPVNGKPFLSYLLQLLCSRGMNEAVLCTGYLGEQVKAYFGASFGSHLGIRYSQEKNGLMGTGGALKLAESLLKDAFLVLNGDTYIDIDYANLLNCFISGAEDAGIVVSPSKPGACSDIDIDGENFVTRYEKSEDAAASYVNAGVMALRRKIVSPIPSERPVSLERDIFPPLIRSHQVKAYPTERPFYDIGTFAGKQIFEKIQGSEKL